MESKGPVGRGYGVPLQKSGLRLQFFVCFTKDCRIAGDGLGNEVTWDPQFFRKGALLKSGCTWKIIP